MECIPKNILTMDQAIADAYRAKVHGWGKELTELPPFNYDGGRPAATGGEDLHGVSATAIISTPYLIEVSMSQPAGYYQYNLGAALAACDKLGPGWRVPTIIELFAMLQNRAALQAIPGFERFKDCSYWSSSVAGGNSCLRCLQNFISGNINGVLTSYYGHYLRCVRDVSKQPAATEHNGTHNTGTNIRTI